MSLCGRHRIGGSRRSRATVGCLALLVLLDAACGGGGGVSTKRVHVIGILQRIPAQRTAAGEDVFVQALEQDGFTQGRNLTLLGENETHSTPDDEVAAVKHWRDLGAELVVAFSTEGARLITQTLPGLPVVFIVNDPVAVGLVHDENKPDGAATGVTFRVPADRTLDLARRAIGTVRTIGLLYARTDPGSAPARDAVLHAASRLGMTVALGPFDGVGDIGAAVDALAVQHVDAILLANSPSAVIAASGAKVEALAKRIPMVANTDYVDFAIAVVQPDVDELNRQVAAQVARLLSGAKPRDVPVEDPRRYEIVLNQGVAAQLGITFPDDVLRVATRIKR